MSQASMSQAPTAQAVATFPSELPASLRCGFCGQLIDGIFFRTFKRFTCERCADQARLAADRQQFDLSSFSRAAVAGAAVALGGAIAWAVIVHVTQWQIGIVASFIGVLVGRAVFKASGTRRGKPLQWLVAVLSVLGVLGGKVIFVTWWIVDSAKQDGDAVNPASVANYLVNLIRLQPTAVISAFDLVWAAIAVYAGWKICKPVQVVVAGPYRYDLKSSSTSSTAPPLQFDTVEPEQQTEPA